MIDFYEQDVSQKLEDLLDVVFEKEIQVEIAKTIINHIKKYHRLSYSETKDLINENGFARSTFYYVLQKMKRLGMVVKLHGTGQYILSKRFGNALNRMYKAWKKLLEEV